MNNFLWTSGLFCVFPPPLAPQRTTSTHTHMCPLHPAIPKATENCAAAYFIAVLFTDVIKQFWWRILNQYYQMVLMISFPGPFWADQLAFKGFLKNKRGFWWFLALLSSWRIVWSSSNARCSAEDRPRELKLVSSELSGNENCEYVFKIVLPYPWTKRQLKTSSNTIFFSLGKGGMKYTSSRRPFHRWLIGGWWGLGHKWVTVYVD